MSVAEILRRKCLSDKARSIIMEVLPVEDQDHSCLMLEYEGFYLQIAFSELHPMIVVYLARGLVRPSSYKDKQLVNNINLKSVLGSHAINDEVGCYSFHSAHWLDKELSKERFFEILTRCTEEATYAYKCFH